MTEEFKFLQIEKDGPIMSCWLNRPDVRNAISTAVEDEWDDVLEVAQADPDVKVLTLQGRGSVFSAGADMKEFASTFVEKTSDVHGGKDGNEGAPSSIRRPAPRSGAARRLWPPPAISQPQLPRSWYFRKTLIAGVHGFVGPYAQRMLAPFDFIIAAEGTRFSWEQSRMGSQNHPLAIYSYQLPMRVIKQLLLMGGWFDAETAHELHLVQRVVAPDALAAEVGKWAKNASTLAIETIAAYKEGIHRMYEAAGLNNIIGIGNNINAHAAGSRGHEFHGALHDTGMKDALQLRDADIDKGVTKI